MDCRDFRNHHLAFLDNTLTDAELAAMQAHVTECAKCSRHDTAMRRGLMLFRNLPVIEPSPDFCDRLNARLHAMNQAGLTAAMYRGPGLGSFIAAAASVVAVGFLAASALSWTTPARELALAPVVATVPEPPPPPPPLVNQRFVASVSAGMPVWPAAMFAEQAQMHFANAEFQLAGWGQ
ncbi:MAG TPA: zf-HC2 domain-containing protein [Gemmatimonadaceae bacterium]|nr:zf-HC2 domain-containing protein [Gemmatimonadaceae bacterium]